MNACTLIARFFGVSSAQCQYEVLCDCFCLPDDDMEDEEEEEGDDDDEEYEDDEGAFLTGAVFDKLILPECKSVNLFCIEYAM